MREQMRRFEEMFGHSPPYSIGIVNVTPDSFSDGNPTLDVNEMLIRVERLFQEGADLVELGGESTRPEAEPISDEEERARIEPILNQISSCTKLALDTYHAKTARLGISRGIRFINDVSALRADPEMAKVVAESGAYITLMYNKEGPLPHATESPRSYSDVVREIVEFLQERVSYAHACGIRDEQIILDTGMGKFVSHDPRYSWEILKRYSECTVLPYPFLIGTSRKGFLGGALHEREERSYATERQAVAQGAVFVRTHTVAGRDWSKEKYGLVSF